MSRLLEIKKTHKFRFKGDDLFKIHMALFYQSAELRNKFSKLIDTRTFDFDNPDYLGRSELSAKAKEEYDKFLRFVFITKATNRPGREEYLLKFFYGKPLNATDKLFKLIMEYLQNGSNLEVLGEKIRQASLAVDLEWASRDILGHLIDITKMFPELKPYVIFEESFAECA